MPRSRKWLITINNPIEHDFDHARIKASVLDLPSVVYWCMCDEQGDECETLHLVLLAFLVSPYLGGSAMAVSSWLALHGNNWHWQRPAEQVCV